MLSYFEFRLSNIGWTALTMYLLIFYIIFFCLRAVYRVTLHPLAKIPGPKIAAITQVYEFYWEVIAGGLYSDKIKEMHEKYGPIIRISPTHLHIIDPEFYDQLYNFSKNIDRPKATFDNLQETPSFEKHRHRRKALGGFFTKSAVLQFEYVVQDNVALLNKIFQQDRGSGKPLSLGLLFRCLTSDIITEYSFARPYGFMQNPEKSKVFFESQDNVFRNVFLFRTYTLAWLALGIFITISELLPGAQKFDGAMSAWMRDTKQRLQQLQKKDLETTKPQESAHHVLLAEYMRNPDVPVPDRNQNHYFDTALLLVSAGFETTANTLETAFYHTLSNPEILKRLNAELLSEFPAAEFEADAQLPWSRLEKLPYLTAVIEESLRLSLGAMARLPRINSHADMVYGKFTIPKGTPVGMSSRFIHYDPEIYPEPKKFDPDRWLQGEESAHLKRYFMPFSRGARVCLGLHLAYAEIYITLATILRRNSDIQLYKTTRKDVDPKFDYFVPKPDSKTGVRVLLN